MNLLFRFRPWFTFIWILPFPAQQNQSTCSSHKPMSFFNFCLLPSPVKSSENSTWPFDPDHNRLNLTCVPVNSKKYSDTYTNHQEAANLTLIHLLDTYFIMATAKTFNFALLLLKLNSFPPPSILCKPQCFWYSATCIFFCLQSCSWTTLTSGLRNSNVKFWSWCLNPSMASYFSSAFHHFHHHRLHHISKSSGHFHHSSLCWIYLKFNRRNSRCFALLLFWKTCAKRITIPWTAKWLSHSKLILTRTLCWEYICFISIFFNLYFNENLLK